MSLRGIKLKYTRDPLPGRITLVVTTPDGSQVSQSMAPGDIATLDLTDRAFVSDEAIKTAESKLSRGEAYYARALVMAPTASTEELIRLAGFLSEHPEPAS